MGVKPQVESPFSISESTHSATLKSKCVGSWLRRVFRNGWQHKLEEAKDEVSSKMTQAVTEG